MGGVTDALLAAVDAAERGDAAGWRRQMQAIHARHVETAHELIGEATSEAGQEVGARPGAVSPGRLRVAGGADVWHVLTEVGPHGGSAAEPAARATPPTLAALQTIRNDVADISAILHAVCLTKGCSEYYRELVVGFGELWCAQILSAYMQCRRGPARALAARPAAHRG